MPRLLLVDGHSNLYRAFYAVRGLTAPDGRPTGAVYGFLRMQHKLLRQLEPTHVAVAFDAGGETFRSRMDASYKANRPPMPEELVPQVDLTQAALRALGLAVLCIENVEADDVIGTLAAAGAAQGLEVIIASTDKDLLQLVADPLVKMWHTRLERLLDERGVEEVFGVPPRQVPEVLSLMGDASDNVPGCPGIGEKGAKELIARWGSVAALYENLEQVTPPRSQRALAAHRQEVELSAELVRIRTDVPLPVQLEELVRGEPDWGALRDLYGSLGFSSLLAELPSVAPPPPPPAPGREAARDEVVQLLAGSGPVAVALGAEELAVAGEGSCLALRAPLPERLELVARAGGTVWCYDAKELLTHVAAAGLVASGTPRDTMLAGYLLAPGENVELAALCRRYQLPPPADTPAERAQAIRRLAQVLQTRLAEEALDAVFEGIELPLVPVLVAMERAGIAIDRKALAELGERLERSLEELEREITAEAGGPFNLNSPQQLAEVLFQRRGLPVLRRTAKTRAPSTDAEVLAELAARGHRLPALLLEYREQAKLKSTYVDTLPRQVGADGRVHTRFNQAVASTGRLSSSDPNLQNIPVRTELGREVRRAFVARPGALLLAADYSQIELRVLAHLSGDPGLLAAFERGEDIHRATAALVFDTDPALVTPSMRRAAKTINFGLIYGMGAYALARDLGVSPGEAQRFIDAYFARLPRVRAFMEETKAQARRTGKVQTLFGRTRWIAGLDSQNPHVRGNAERMAMNAPIQGTAADLMKLAMIRLHEVVRHRQEEAQLLLQVHDELVLEVAEGCEEEIGQLVRQAMEGAAHLRVPLAVEVGVGRSWAEAKG
jgi:DNA polymerase-1